MKVNFVTAFWTQKKGNSIDEYEDAFSDDRNKMTYAISDGATEATFSKEWANILVKNYIVNPPELVNEEWMVSSYNEFCEKVDVSNLPWFAQNKLIDQGSYATLLGLQISIVDKSFLCHAIGDSCLFWMDEQGIHSFPYRSVEEFNSRPTLISTYKRNNIQIYDSNQNVINNKFSDGRTRIFLMTDALSLWFLNEHTNGYVPWTIFDSIETNEQFVELVEDLRGKRVLKNDDVTLMIIDVENISEVDNDGISTDE